MKAFLSFLLVILTIHVSAQEIQNSITGVALEENGDPLLYANILLLAAQDSVLTKAELTDDSGKYKFSDQPAGNYFIRISYVGMEEYSSDVFTLGAQEVKTMELIKLQAGGNDLEEVTVTAERSMIEVRPDKIVFNVENSIGAGGSNALELLRKSPGVVLDNNENVTLMGKSGVRIYINDRPARLSGTDLANYLRSLNAADIDNIEIITNPSAKYEAEGNAGIINIKLKKNKNFGTNGSITGNYGNGVVEDWSGQLQLNHRKNFYNIFGSYGYNDAASYNFEALDREQEGLFYDQRFDHYNYWEGHNVRLGSDFFINKNHTLGFIVSANNNTSSGPGFSNTEIGSLTTRNVVDSILIAETQEIGDNDRFDVNLNYQIKGENDLFWNVDLNYGTYNTESEHTYENFYSTPELLGRRGLTNNEDSQNTQIDIYTGRLDFEKNVGIGKLAVGLKSSIVDTDNSFQFYNVLNDTPILNIGRSSDYTYYENVNAAYANYDWKKEKLTYQLGLRTEASNTEGVLQGVNQDSTVTRNYIDLFPSAGVTYQMSQKSTIGLGYSRRLDRPNYSNLNPFVYLINDKTTSTGDPFLRPQYTTNIQLNHTYNYSVNTVLKYSRTKDLMTRFSEAVELEDDVPAVPGGEIIATGERFFWENLGSQQNLSLNISAPYSITEWWSTFTSITASVVSNQGDYGEGKVVDIVRPAINFYGQHTFKLPKDFSFELSGWYSAGGVWGGNFETGPMGQMSVGMQKKLFKNQGTLKVNFTDIFLTSRWKANVNFGILKVSGFGGWDSQRLRVSYTHSFGNQKVKSRNRKTGSEEEGKRIGN